jgi:hypothetical protein
METGSDGKLWLRDILSVGDGIASTVAIGYNPNKTKPGNSNAHEVINANDNFIVYEDGSIRAEAGYIGDLTVQ